MDMPFTGIMYNNAVECSEGNFGKPRGIHTSRHGLPDVGFAESLYGWARMQAASDIRHALEWNATQGIKAEECDEEESMRPFSMLIYIYPNSHELDRLRQKALRVALRKMAMVPVRSGSANGDQMEAWRAPLTEEIFNSPGSNLLNTFFREGSLFDPFLFGSFMDPAEPLALWDFDPLTLRAGETAEALLWSETDDGLLLRARLPGLKKNDVQVIVEDGRILEISGQWKKRQARADSRGNWREGQWWEVGYVRRLTLPENADVDNIHAIMENGVLDITIPKVGGGAGGCGATAPAKQVKVIEVID